MKKVSIGGCSAFWGDLLDPVVLMAETADVQYLAFDHLAELTMSLLHRMKEKNPERGFIPDIIPWHKALLPITTKRGIKMVSNGGGANPIAGAKAVVNVAKELGLTGFKVAAVTGDDLTDRLDELRAKGIKLTNLDTGEEDIDSIKDKIVSAYAYVGSESIIDALKEGADTVIAGRVSDNACYVGPWMYEFGWEFDKDIDKIDAAITCGHIIECSSCVTGGAMCSLWKDVPEPWNVGYPIMTMDENGEAILSKTPNTGGLVNTWTAREHLAYEIHDPSNYLMPDGVPDFTRVKLEDIGKDMVKVSNMGGKSRPDTLKVGIGYQAGWKQEIQQWFCWPDALEKAKRAEYILREWLKRERVKPVDMEFNYMGFNMQHKFMKVPESAPDLPEVGIRCCVKYNTREDAMRFRRNAFLWTGFPAGWCFNTTTAPAMPAPIIALWPTLVPRGEIKTEMTMMEVK